MRSRLGLRSLLLSLVLLASQDLAFAQKAGPGESEIVKEGSFVVYSELDLEKERARTIVARVKAAYDFVASEQGWAGDQVLEHDVGVRVVTDERMKEMASKKTKGVTLDKNTFAMTAALLEEERGAHVIAHELAHLQDRRHLEAKGAKLPHWFKEGRAIAMGRAYEIKLGKLDARYEASIARIGSSMGAAEAKRILEDEAYLSEKKMANVARMEALGFLFLEFVKVRFQCQDFDHGLAKVVVAVGKGDTLEEAFATKLGVKLAEARDAFYKKLDAAHPQ